MEQDFLRTIERAVDRWRPSGTTNTASDILALCNSPFFRQYALLTDQLITVLDHTSMKYLYVSETIPTLTGLSMEKLLAEGVAYVVKDMHPEDAGRFESITNVLQDGMSSLDPQQILQCCTSYSYRLRFPKDGTYHHMVQHNVPLALGRDNKIAQVLVMMWDITPYKRDENCTYRIVLHNNGDARKVLLEGMVGNAPTISITGREKDVLRLTAEGWTEKEISNRLNVSLQTVKTHRKNLLRKTGVANSIELVKFAVSNMYI